MQIATTRDGILLKAVTPHHLPSATTYLRNTFCDCLPGTHSKSFTVHNCRRFINSRDESPQRKENKHRHVGADNILGSQSCQDFQQENMSHCSRFDAIPEPCPLVFELNGRRMQLAPDSWNMSMSLNDYLRAQPSLRGTVGLVGLILSAVFTLQCLFEAVISSLLSFCLFCLCRQLLTFQFLSLNRALLSTFPPNS